MRQRVPHPRFQNARHLLPDEGRSLFLIGGGGWWFGWCFGWRYS
ncbi:hypothetical protein M3J07_011795 [Ascochyta lentis]